MADWEALPPRKRNRRNISSNSDAVNGESTIHHINRNICDHQQEVDDAVHKRSFLISSPIMLHVNSDLNQRRRTVAGRALNPLGALDGAGGEFYEWGATLQAAFENIIPCMFNYATDLSVVGVDQDQSIEFTVQGHDLYSLLYKYMDEFLFRFCSDGFCCKEAKILSIDKELFSLRVQGLGELFDLARHTQGTEIKAITYSNMQIHETSDRTDVYVIIDI